VFHLLTALVASLGFVPAVLSGCLGARVQYLLAAVVSGGIIPVTALILLLPPALCRLLEHDEDMRNAVS